MSIKEKAKEIVTQEDIMKFLDSAYSKAINGIQPVSPPIEEFAENYLSKYETPEIAAKSMINYQIAKCTTSGFVTGFGGAITLPVTIPANIGSVVYVQLRMIACAAYMAGYDIKSDQVQTLIYACLAGVAVNNVVKKAGIKFGEKFVNVAVKKIPGRVLVKINQKVGFRFLTKFGEKGIINMGKLIPGVGAVINGGFDLVETKIIANRAYKMFFENDFSEGEEIVITDADFEDVPEDTDENE